MVTGSLVLAGDGRYWARTSDLRLVEANRPGQRTPAHALVSPVRKGDSADWLFASVSLLSGGLRVRCAQIVRTGRAALHWEGGQNAFASDRILSWLVILN